MAVKELVDGLHMIPGVVNTYLIEAADGLTLIDTGLPKGDKAILGAIRDIGRSPGDLKNIVLTHAHPDHIGGLAAVVLATGARTFMHALDMPIAERGSGFRPMTAAPGLLSGLLFRLFSRPGATVDPATIDQPLSDGEVLPIAGGLEVIGVPGHCAGQVALLWRQRRVLFAADVCANMMGLGPPIGYEDRGEGESSQRKLAALDFDIACFGHGKPILRDAGAAFRKIWAA